jgi:hypothetical protein
MIVSTMIRQRITPPSFHFHVEGVGIDGNILWTESVDNLVTDQGLDEILKLLSGERVGTLHTECYLVLNGNSNTVVSTITYGIQGTAASQWSEVTDINESTRVAWNPDAVSGKSVVNSTARVFTITTGLTVYGAGIVFAFADSSGITTIGNTAATNGVLYCMSTFSSSQTVKRTDKVRITATLTSSDDGV